MFNWTNGQLRKGNPGVYLNLFFLNSTLKLKPCWLFHNCNWIIFCKLKSYLTVKYIVLCVNTTWWRKIKNEPILYLVAKRKIISHFPLSYLQSTLGSNVSETIQQQQENIVYTHEFSLYFFVQFTERKKLSLDCVIVNSLKSLQSF